MFCGKCGANVDNGQLFCPKCGARLGEETNTTADRVKKVSTGGIKIKVPFKGFKSNKVLSSLFTALGVILLVFLMFITSLRGGFSEKRIERGFKNLKLPNVEIGEFMDAIGYSSGLDEDATVLDWICDDFHLEEDEGEEFLTSKKIKKWLSSVSWGYVSDLFYGTNDGKLTKKILDEFTKIMDEELDRAPGLYYSDSELKDTALKKIIKENDLQGPVDVFRFIVSSGNVVLIVILIVLFLAFGALFSEKSGLLKMKRPGTAIIIGSVIGTVITVVAMFILRTVLRQTLFLDRKLLNKLIVSPVVGNAVLKCVIFIIIGIALITLSKKGVKSVEAPQTEA